MNPIYRKRNQFLMKTRLHTLCVTCFIFFVLCVSLPETSYSQSIIIGNEKSRFEIGLNIGPSFFLGDLGGHAGKGQRFVKDLNLPLTKLMVGAFATYYPNEWMGVRLAAQYGKISAEDEIITTKGENELYRKQRNLDFRT